MTIRHNITKSINNNLELAKELSWIREDRASLLTELSFDIIFNYDDPRRCIEKIINCYSNKSSSDEDNKEIIDKICEVNEFV